MTGKIRFLCPRCREAMIDPHMCDRCGWESSVPVEQVIWTPKDEPASRTPWGIIACRIFGTLLLLVAAYGVLKFACVWK